MDDRVATTTAYGITCDHPGCHAATGQRRSWPELRDTARADGWTVSGDGGQGADLCPQHSAASHQAAAVPHEV